MTAPGAQELSKVTEEFFIVSDPNGELDSPKHYCVAPWAKDRAWPVEAGDLENLAFSSRHPHWAGWSQSTFRSARANNSRLSTRWNVGRLATLSSNIPTAKFRN
jgi:hypothetical protein